MSWDTVPGKNREGYPDPTARPLSPTFSAASEDSKASEPGNTSRTCSRRVWAGIATRAWPSSKRRRSLCAR